jgi:hypothetical protein
LAAAKGDAQEAGSAGARWAVRIVVLTAFALTVWLCGPRAAAVLAAKLQLTPNTSPIVELDHVGFTERPAWLDRPLLLAVSAACSPWLRGEVPILDEDAMRQLRDGLASVSWIRSAAVERDYPNRFRLKLDLRRPVLAVRSADGDPLCLVDCDAVVLPWVDTPLPVTYLHREGGPPRVAIEPGQLTVDARVRVAAGIVVEWNERLAPLVAGCPQLLEVDTTNIGERWLRGPRYPEVRVKLARSDGAGVTFAYGRPVDSPAPRVPVHTKATVLAKILAQHPGLDGLVAGDLRFARRWADYLQPRPAGVRDPTGPWSELLVPRGG